MVKDVIPFLNQDQICLDVARVNFHSKIDMLDVYEQICVEPEDVDKLLSMELSLATLCSRETVMHLPHFNG